MSYRFYPKLLTVLREGYRREDFFADLSAGVVVGIVALPLAIAFAIASGVKPEQGLFTAIVAGFVIAVLGGSRVQVSGPTGAFIVVVYGIVQEHGYDGLAVATLLAGLMMVVAGFAGLGGILKFIPYPLTVGFTSGIALIIFSSQMRDLLGLSIQKMPARFLDQWQVIFLSIDTLNWNSVTLGVGSLAILALAPKFTRKIPASIIVLAVGIIVSQLFHLPVETIGSRFGAVPNSFPKPHMLNISWTHIQELFGPALTIALLGSVESLLSAVVADGMIGTRHRSNTELIAQGVGNIVSPFFLGVPATGAIARTATNIKNGGRTPIAAIIHAITLLIIMLFFAQYAVMIPMASLAAILVFVAWNMSERRSFIWMFKSPRSDLVVMLTTFALTLLIDLTVAIEVGVVLSSLLFMRRMAQTAEGQFITGSVNGDEEERDDPRPISRRVVPPGVEVFEIYGPLFFGAVGEFRNALSQVKGKAKVLILRMRNVPAIDASGIQFLTEILADCRREKTTLLLSGLAGHPRTALKKAGFEEQLGSENICFDIDAALSKAASLLKKAKNIE